eukprot:TRINITY_DN1579_c0_g1_i12.p1 TRINITY_DN1579_c0_g1~~TRINITY_DN1579_c0_g1_i12.p1  ORF type:complete len:126 (+),score=18.93 TRINITY_DN1579_c0_g1_i12:65-442(+)
MCIRDRYMGIGGFLMWRVDANRRAERRALRRADADETKTRFLFFFATLVLASGLSSFILEKDWFASFSPILKIPLYTLLGLAISFSVNFALIDLINYLYALFNDGHRRTLVETTPQVAQLYPQLR